VIEVCLTIRQKMQLQTICSFLFFCFICIESKKANNQKTIKNEECTIKNKIAADHIDMSLNDLSQDDPILVNLIRERYLIEPSKKAINLTKPASTETLKGQFGQPIFLDESYYK
jgi:hypothetical protein